MSLISENTEGVFIISATPFDDSGSIDFESAKRLVEFYIDKGVSGITILGMMGEAPKLSDKESVSFMSSILTAVDGRLPVVVGVSQAGLDGLNTLSRQAMDLGAAGVMVAPVGHLKTEQAIYSYYNAVVNKLGDDIPVCYQDYPLATTVHISVPTFNRLVEDFPSIVMLKHEDWPGLNKITLIRQSVEESNGRRVSILCGNGGLYLPQELARGADGAMTGFAYPEMLVQVCQLFKDGEKERAEDIFDAYLPLVRHEQQPGFGLAIRKEVLRRRGVIGSAKTRAPGPALNKVDHAELDRLIARLNKKLEEI